MVDGAADRHSGSVFRQHRQVCGADAAHRRGDVVNLGVERLVSDQTPDVVGEAVRCEFLGQLGEKNVF